MPKPIEYFRSQYKHLNDGTIYFNHAAVSPLSKAVLDRVQEFLAMRSQGSIDDYPWIIETTRKAKEKTGFLLNCEPDRIAFADNTSNALNIIAQGIKWQSGDEIILNDIEFPSNVYPFLNLRRHGVNIKFVNSRNGIVSAEDIIAAAGSRTKLISVSSVQFLSGYRADIKQIGAFCRQHGIIFCVDAIQQLGAIRLDTRECCIDFLAAGTQKWLMGMMGLAVVYLTAETQARISQSNVGWLSVENAWDVLNYDLTLKQTADAFQCGTSNVLGTFGFLGALELFEESGAQFRETVILDNSQYFINQLTENGFDPVLGGVDRSNLSGIVTIRCGNAEAVFNALKDNGVTCSLRVGMIRFSPHYYNTRSEIDRAVELLRKYAG